MGKGAGTDKMEWKDVSGQNHHATVYGSPKLVWDTTFPDGVSRKAVHFAPSDSIDFPVQSNLGFDYSVFAVAGYRQGQDPGKVFKLIGDTKTKITKGRVIDAGDVGISQLDLPYSYTIHCDLTLNSAGSDSQQPEVVFVLSQKGLIAKAGHEEGKAPAVLFDPKDDTLIVIDGDQGGDQGGDQDEADCSMKNFPVGKESHLEIQIRLEKMVVKVNGAQICNVKRDDRSQSKDTLEQNAHGRFLTDAQLNLGGGLESYVGRAAANGDIRNFEITSEASVGAWGRIFQASDKDWCVCVCVCVCMCVCACILVYTFHYYNREPYMDCLVYIYAFKVHSALFLTRIYLHVAIQGAWVRKRSCPHF